MLDHRSFLDTTTDLWSRLESRGVSTQDLDHLRTLVDKRRHAIQSVEELRHRLKQESQSVQEKAKAGDTEGVSTARAALKGLKAEIKEGEEALEAAETTMGALLLTIPNVPHNDVPVGADEAANKVEKTVGTPRTFDFTPKPHWELGEDLGILDFERASKISGARFSILRDAGARLERALAAFMLDHARERGFVEVSAPLLVRRDSMQAAGQYPKFIGESFETLDNEYALIPTSEIPLVNLHRDEILSEEELPIRYCSLTPCFRREAGAAGRDTRGLIRQHQFYKVELVSVCHPDRSDDELEHLTQTAESVLAALDLPYQVMTLSTGDMGFCATKTHDLEVWLPAQETYREISSCSNCSDFQARRAQIRFRPSSGTKPKPQLVHTLNGSSLAVGRTLVAILENGQQADGSIVVPEALRPYFGDSAIKPG